MSHRLTGIFHKCFKKSKFFFSQMYSLSFAENLAFCNVNFYIFKNKNLTYMSALVLGLFFYRMNSTNAFQEPTYSYFEFHGTKRFFYKIISSMFKSFNNTWFIICS